MYNNNFGQMHVILVPAIGTYLPQKYERKFFRSRPNPYSCIPVKEVFFCKKVVDNQTSSQEVPLSSVLNSLITTQPLCWSGREHEYPAP